MIAVLAIVSIGAAAELAITVEGSTDSRSVVLSGGSTMAYAVAKATRWNPARTRIEDLEQEFMGMEAAGVK